MALLVVLVVPVLCLVFELQPGHQCQPLQSRDLA
jgi:hypothetical protein